MNTRPFDLKEALGHPERVVTRNGRKVLYMHDTGLNIPLPLVVFVDGDDGIDRYKVDGGYNPNSIESCNDLVMLVEPVVVERFRNIYPADVEDNYPQWDTFGYCVSQSLPSALAVQKTVYTDGIPTSVEIVHRHK